MGIDAVIFDWGGTLTVHVEVELLDMWRIAAEHLDPGRADELTKMLVEVEAASWARTVTTQRSARLMDLLREASDELGVDVAEAVLDAAAGAHLDAWTPNIRHREDAVATLEAIRDMGLKVGLLSNTHWPRAYHEHFLERDGLAGLIDARVFTSEIDWIKPHAEPFNDIAQQLRVDPANCVMVGDRPIDDIEGAVGAGMRAVWVVNDWAPGDPAGAHGRITELAQLPSLLASWPDP